MELVNFDVQCLRTTLLVGGGGGGGPGRSAGALPCAFAGVELLG